MLYFFQIRGYAPNERLEETQLALTVAPLALNYYSEKFQIKYMLPKLGNSIYR